MTKPVASRRAEAEGLDAETARLLSLWTGIIADWADRMPLRTVYVFGDHARGEAAPTSKLKLAIEYADNASDDVMRNWQQENATGFAALKRALGVETEFYADQDYDVWPPIRDAARAPLMAVRKVKVVRTEA